MSVSTVSSFLSKNNEWRKHPDFIPSTNVKHMFPGLGTAIVLFTAYVMFDNMMSTKSVAPNHTSNE